MAASSSGTPSLVSLSLPAQSSQPMAVDRQAALEELAKKARIAQVRLFNLHFTWHSNYFAI
jgi:hypothetical protein